MKFNRKWVTQLHLIFAGVFLPLFILMPLSGVFHLLGWDGGTQKLDLFVLQTRFDETTSDAELEALLQAEFEKKGYELNYETMKRTKTRIVFRPSSRRHHAIELTNDGSWLAQEVSPSFSDRLLELHKGHGPTLFKWLEIAFGVAIVFVLGSGAIMALTLASYRKSYLAAVALGVGLASICLI